MQPSSDVREPAGPVANPPAQAPVSILDWMPERGTNKQPRVSAKRRGWHLIAGVAAWALLSWAAYQAILAINIEHARRANAQRLDFYGASLESLLEKHESLPYLTALHPDVAAVLEKPADAKRVDAANRYLEAARNSARVAAVYVLTLQGHTVAASNWAVPQTFVGQNYGFRPYFLEAIEGRLGRFYAVGVTTGEPGYFLAAPVRAGGNVVGAVAVKLGLEDFEQALARSGEHVLVVDNVGVVFLATHKPWKYHTLGTLAPEERARLDVSRQYADAALQPVDSKVALNPDESAQRATLRLPHAGNGERIESAREFLVQSRPVGQLGWRIVLLSNLEAARLSAAGLGAAVGFAAAFLFAAATIWYLRRRRLEERSEARAVLQRAYDELELRIAERTAELVTANASLQQKISTLKQTETILRETQDTAVQAGKLAVLGQMAAGITHEINQPLAALRTLSDNARRLLELARPDEARDNLHMIGQTAERMGRIVGQLKTFARKGPAELQPISVADALSNAMLLVESRSREHAVEIEVVQPDVPVRVVADAIRLEQVLVNLLRNAIDAMEAVADKRLTITVELREGHAYIRIRDRGPGIAADVLPHLFEPFYTTKPVGKGLGLGLAISLSITRSFGGELRASNAPDGGAQFELSLIAA
jgi:two-component system, NtrC family, C4-dicarboxylate transport sensor histidine kinase DctB